MAADDQVYDTDVLPKNAANAQERRRVFDAAIARWPNDDVGKIQRIEPVGGNFGYALWRYPRGVASQED